MPSPFYAAGQQPVPGAEPDLVQRFSLGVDELLRPISERTRQLGGEIAGGLAGVVAPQYQQQATLGGQVAGQAFPRMALQTAPVMLGGFKLAATPWIRAAQSALTSPTAKALGVGDIGAQTWTSLNQMPGAEQLTTPQKLGATATSVGTFLAAPYVGGAFGHVGAGLAAPLTDAIRRVGGPTSAGLIRTGVQKTGSLLGTLGAFEAGAKASSAIVDQPYGLGEMLSPEHIAEVGISVLPFEIAGLPHLPGQVKANVEMQRAKLFTDLSKSVEASKAFERSYMTRSRDVDAAVDDKTVAGKVSTEAPLATTEPAVAATIKTEPTASTPPLEADAITPIGREYLDTHDKRLLADLESLGYSQEAMAASFEALRKHARLPTENWWDYQARKLGIDPRVNQSNDPNTLFATGKQILEAHFRDVLQLPEAQAQFWTRYGLQLMATVGHSLGETRMMPSLPYTDPGSQLQHEGSFYYAPRDEKLNAFMGILVGKATAPSVDAAIGRTFNHMAHELFHGMQYQALYPELYKGNTVTLSPERIKAIHNVYDAVKDMSQQDMADAVHTMLTNMSAKRGGGGAYEARHLAYTEDPQGRWEMLADSFALFATGAVARRPSRAFNAIDEFLRFGSDDYRQFAKGLLLDMGRMIHAIKDYAAQQFGLAPSKTAVFDRLIENFDKLLATADEADAAVDTFLRITQTQEARPWAPIAPVNYKQVTEFWRARNTPIDPEISQLAREISPMVVPATDSESKRMPKDLPIRLGFMDFFKALPQLARSVPIMADMAYLGRNYGSLAKEMVHGMMEYFKDPTTQRVDVDGFTTLLKKGSARQKAWNDITLKENELSEDRDGQRLTADEINQIDSFRSLSAGDREFVMTHLDRRSQAFMYAAKKLYDSFRSIVSHKVSTVAMGLDRKLPWQEAETLGKAVATLHMDQDVMQGGPEAAGELWRDAATAQKVINDYIMKDAGNALVVQRLNEIFTKVPAGGDVPEGGKVPLMHELLKYRTQLLGPWEQGKTGQWGFRGKPGYSPEVRLGRWIMYWKTNDVGPVKGKTHVVGYKTEAEFKAKFAELNQLWSERKIEYFGHHDKSDLADAFAGVKPDKFKTYVDVIERMNNHVIAEFENQYGDLSPFAELIKELRDELKPAKALAGMLESPHMKERRLLGGREELNMAEGMIHYINNVAFTIAKRYETGQHRLFLMDPKMRENPQPQMIARKYFAEITDPKDNLPSWVRSLVAFNYVFFSPSLFFIELTQQALNHVPALISQGMPVGEAYKQTLKANLDMINAWRKGRSKGSVEHEYDDPNETAVMREFARKGVIDKGWLQEFWRLEDDLAFINARNFFSGNGTILDRTGLIGKPLHQLYRLGTNAHGIAITINTEVAALSAYRYFKSLGQSNELAFRNADDLTRESMQGGGKASRPLWFLGIGPGPGGKGSPGPTIGGVMYMLQTYAYNTVAQQARYLYSAIKNTARSPAEVTAAHKAAGAMLATSVLLGGIGGIPMTSQLLALIEQIFPEAEPRRRMREFFFRSGEKINQKWHLMDQDADMGEFISTAASDGLANAAGPWNMGNRFELGVLMGVDPYKGFDWKNVIGPSAPLLEQIVLGPAKKLGQHDYTGAAIAGIPNSNVRRLATLAADGWQVRNQDDRLNVKLSAAESAMMAAGFTPKRVTAFREMNEMKKRAEQAHTLEQRRFHNDMASLVIGGETAKVTAALMNRAATIENYDPREGARRIAEVVQAKTMPHDPRREGSKVGQTYNVNRLFAGEPPQQSETQRLLQRNMMTQQLGFPAPITSSGVRAAQTVDRLMAMYPNMSRQEALAMLEKIRPARAGEWWHGMSAAQ